MPTQAAVTTIVKKAIHKEIENKRVGLHVVDDTFNSAIGGDAYSLLPPIQPVSSAASGASTGNLRQGDRVRPRYLVVRGTVQWDVDYATNFYCNPATARLMILTQKNIKVGNAAGMAAVDLGHLLKDNIGTDVAHSYTGDAYDNLAPINTELFKVHMDKKVKLLPYYAGNAASAGMASGTNRTYSFVKKIKCPATLTFDDGNGVFANNFAPFFVFGAVFDDGTAPTTVRTPWRVVVSSILDYEDA